jgi:7,8-dihydropterin-6-yl-methyl-4-(beta-D-ribofuranosyl)aminobenzene 5'-phosphate synthase
VTVGRAGAALVGLSVSAMLLAGCAATVPTEALPSAARPSPPITAPAPTRATTAAPPATELTQSPTSTSSASATRNAITVLYDNVPYDKRLQTDWGFSALIEYQGETVLFDAGANGKILLANMRTLGVDPAGIRQVVLSHVHSDHTAGLPAFLDVSSKPPVFLLTAFGPSYIRGVRARTGVVETSAGMAIAPGLFVTGKVAGSVPEQALAIRTPLGLVVVTGCAHPGVDQMVKAAEALSGEPVFLVMGGFHLADSSRAHISAVVAALRQLGVQKVAPSHCTGATATRMLADAYGEDFIQSGAGRVIFLDE